MIKRCQNETDSCLQQDGEAADQKNGNGLLHILDIEIAIEENAAAIIPKERLLSVERFECDL